MTEQARGGGRATDRHFDRLYRRIDELSNRVAKLERNMYIGVGGLGTVAIFNLISNVANMAGGGQ